MKLDKALILFALALLLIVNWLTFHDVAESHSFRDWLLLVASAAVFLYFANTMINKQPKQRRSKEKVQE